MLQRSYHQIFFIRIFAWLLSLAWVLAACGGGQTATPAPSPIPATAAPASPTSPPPTPTVDQGPPTPKAATFLFTQEFDTLNPLFTTIWTSQITQQIWNCWAWDFDDQNNPRPVLVKEIPSFENGGISADGKVLTLRLREEIVWSDGTPLTAADFAFTYQMAIDPNNGADPNSAYQQLESLATPDERTVVATFKAPYVPWLTALWHGLLPAHILQPVYTASGNLREADWNKAPTVGCGPYTFVEWQAGSFARFTYNDRYWAGRPKITDLTIRFLADEAAQIAALKAGEGDLGTYLPFDKVPELESAGVQIIKAFSGYNEGWFFYLDPVNGHPALQDLRVRQAIALGFDRNALTQNLLLGLTQPAISYWDNTPYIDPTLQSWPYDPARAAQLLDEAGWIDTDGDLIRDKDGVALVLSYGTTMRQLRKDAQALIQQQLGQLGIRLELFNYDLGVFLSGYATGGPAATGQLDIFQYSVKPEFPDAATPDFLCSEIPSLQNQAGRNWSAFCDQELDQLFQQQARQIDFKARQETFQRISRLIYDKVYFLGLWQDPDLWGMSARLSNVRISGVTPFFSILEWEAQ